MRALDDELLGGVPARHAVNLADGGGAVAGGPVGVLGDLQQEQEVDLVNLLGLGESLVQAVAGNSDVPFGLAEADAVFGGEPGGDALAVVLAQLFDAGEGVADSQLVAGHGSSGPAR